MLCFDGIPLSGYTISSCGIDLLKQTPNIHSLTLTGRSLRELNLLCSGDAFSAIFRGVDSSKLTILSIPVDNLNQMQALLETFRNLISVRFPLPETPMTTQEILRCVETVRRGSLIVESHGSVSI